MDNQGTINLKIGLNLDKAGATYNNTGTINIPSGRMLTVSGAPTFNQIGGTLAVAGSYRQISGGIFSFQGGVVSGAGTFELVSGTFNLSGASTITPEVLFPSGGALNIAAGATTTAGFRLYGNTALSGNVAAGQTLTVVGDPWAGNATLTAASGFTNTGVINLTETDGRGAGSTLAVTNGVLTNTGTINSNYVNCYWCDSIPRWLRANVDNQGTINLNVSLNLDKAGAVYNNTGTINVPSGHRLIVKGAPTFNQNGGVLAIAGAYSHSGGAFRFTGGSISGGGTLSVNSATFFGTGTITANVNSNSSQFNPGLSPGVLNITGNYMQDAGSALNVEIAGPNPGTGYDQLNVSGVATLAGTLNVITAPTFCPQGNFTIMTYGSRSGDFAVKNGLKPAGGGSYEPLPGPTTYVLKGTGCNTAPVANSDSYATSKDTSLTVPPPGVLANDTDAESNPLTALLLAGPSNGSVTLNANGSFTYTPNANFNGTDTFTYKANDGTTDSAAATVAVTVNSVNDSPSFSKGADQTVNEDAGPQTVSGWATSISAGPPDEGAQTVAFVVSNNNTALFSAQPAVSATGTLTYTPASNATGFALVTVQLKDSGGTANGGVDTSAPQTFRITVAAVNDAPSFTKGADQTVGEDAGPQTVNGWATAISAGPPEEVGQALTFLVSNNNNALFSAQPAISPSGTLSYTPAPSR